MKIICLCFILILTHLLDAQIMTFERYEKYGPFTKETFHFKGNVKYVTTDNFKAIIESGRVVAGGRKGNKYFNDQDFYEFDLTGRLIAEGSLFKNQRSQTIAYLYDETKQIMHVNDTYETGKLNYTFEYDFTATDGFVNIIESHATLPALTQYYQLYYGDDKLLDSINTFNAKEEFQSIRVYNRNVQKQVSNFKNKYAQIIMDEIQTEYNAEGLPIMETAYALSKLYTIKKMAYDKYGNLTSLDFHFELDEDNNYLINIEYEYDANGNWIKRIVNANGEPEDYCVRKIEYF